jgi:hypothetical protein
LKLHNHALRTSIKDHGGFWLHNRTLLRWGKLAGGEVGPGKVNKQGESSIGLTRDRSASEVRPEKCPVMVGGGAVAVRLPRLGF